MLIPFDPSQERDFEKQKEQLRRRRDLINHYHQILAQADYVFLASDAVTGQGIGTLWARIWLGFEFEAVSFMMVSPGIKALTSLPEYISTPAHGFYEDKETESVPYQSECFFSALKSMIEWERPHGRSSLYIMNSPKAEVSDSRKLAYNDSTEWEDATEKLALSQAIAEKFGKKVMVLISQDTNFLLSIRERFMLNSDPQQGLKSLLTLSVRDNGELYDPFEADGDDLKNRAASAQLFSLAEALPIYIEDGALKHPAAMEFLQNIHIPLLHNHKQMILLADEDKRYPMADIIDARANATPATIRLAWLDPAKSKSEAMVDLLTKEASATQSSHIVLITDRVPRAERIQLKLDGMGIQMDIYSINQYGYLSSRDKGKEKLLKNRERVVKKNARTEWEAAIREEDMAKIQLLVSKRAAIEEGMRVCLLTGKAALMEMLIDSVPSVRFFPFDTLLVWWICEFRQFQQPTYLIEKPEFYRLLVKTLTLCRLSRINFKKIEQHLDALSEKTNRSVEEIEYLNEMFYISADRAPITTSPLRSYRLKSTYPLDRLPSTHGNIQTVLEIHKRDIEQKLQDIEAQLSALEVQRTDLLIQLDNINTKLEFQWEETDSSTLNKAKLTEWLTRYKEVFAKRWETEQYKWRAICDFRNHWNLEEENLCAIVEFSLKPLGQNSRLLRPFAHRMAYGMLHEFAKHETENTRDLFRKLYDGINRENAEEHITRFLEEVTEMKERRRIDDMPIWHNHFQTKSTTSALLWVHAPQQFFYAEPRWAQACFNELELPYNGSGLRFQYTEVLENIGTLLRELKKRTYALKTMLAPYIKKLNVDADTAVAILVNDFAEFVGIECVMNRHTSL